MIAGYCGIVGLNGSAVTVSFEIQPEMPRNDMKGKILLDPGGARPGPAVIDSQRLDKIQAPELLAPGWTDRSQASVTRLPSEKFIS